MHKIFEFHILKSYMTSPNFHMELTKEHHTDIVKLYYKGELTAKIVHIMNEILSELKTDLFDDSL